MAYASRMSQEQMEANKRDRIDLTICEATASRDRLPKGLQARWAADLMPPGSSEEKNLRKFMEDPAKNEFVLFFETKKQAMDYARALDLLMGRSGVLSRIVVFVSEKSPQDEGKYDLLPKQNYKVSLTAEERKTITRLSGREEAILKKFGAAEESLQAVVPSKKPAADENLIAELQAGISSRDPLFGSAGESDLEAVPQKAEKEKGVARIVPLPDKFTDRQGDTLPLIPNKTVRAEVEDARKSGNEYTFTVVGDSRKNALEDFLKTHGTERVEVTERGNRKFEVTINKLTDWERKIREMKGQG